MTSCINLLTDVQHDDVKVFVAKFNKIYCIFHQKFHLLAKQRYVTKTVALHLFDHDVNVPT